MGIPYRIVISERLLESNEAEIVHRGSGETKMVVLEDVLNQF